MLDACSTSLRSRWVIQAGVLGQGSIRATDNVSDKLRSSQIACEGLPLNKTSRVLIVAQSLGRCLGQAATFSRWSGRVTLRDATFEQNLDLSATAVSGFKLGDNGLFFESTETRHCCQTGEMIQDTKNIACAVPHN